MNRYTIFHEDGAALETDLDGEWIRYTDHCEAMKRIAGDGVQGLTRDALYEAIHGALMEHGLSYTEDTGSGEKFPLVDKLCAPGDDTIQTGKDEITILAEAILNVIPDVLAKAAPSASAQQAEPVVVVRDLTDACDKALEVLDQLMNERVVPADILNKPLDAAMRVRVIGNLAAPAPSASPAYVDSTPQLKVGDSSFESWYEQKCAAGWSGQKQLARDAYAAGMGDPLVMARDGASPAALTDEQIKECLGEVRWSNNDAWCVDRIRALLAASPADQGDKPCGMICANAEQQGKACGVDCAREDARDALMLELLESYEAIFRSAYCQLDADDDLIRRVRAAMSASKEGASE